jgi:hypothetical protein
MILFLDFDGVTHPISGQMFDLSCLKQLEDVLVQFPDVEVVISSSWREFMDLKQIRKSLGEIIGHRVVGITPVISESGIKHVRYHEVLKYLEDKGMLGLPWVALDDERQCYPDNTPVIWCDSRVGVSESESKQLESILRVLYYHIPDSGVLRTFLVEHPEENLTLAIISNEGFPCREYFYCMKGEVDEAQISEILKVKFPSYPQNIVCHYQTEI